MVKGIASKPEDLTSMPITHWHRESAACRDEWRWGGPAELGGEYSHSIGVDDYHLYTRSCSGHWRVSSKQYKDSEEASSDTGHYLCEYMKTHIHPHTPHECDRGEVSATDGGPA